MASNVRSGDGIGKYLAVYICILAIAGLQFVIAYSTSDPGRILLFTQRGWNDGFWLRKGVPFASVGK